MIKGGEKEQRQKEVIDWRKEKSSQGKDPKTFQENSQVRDPRTPKKETAMVTT